MRLGIHGIVAAALLSLAGCENHPFRDPPPERGPLLTGETIRNTLLGNSLVTAPEVIPPMTVYFDDGDEMRGRHSTNYEDVGSWEVDDDAVCAHWDNWRGVLNRCWNLYRLGDRITLLRPEDGRQVDARLVQGNVDNL